MKANTIFSWATFPPPTPPPPPPPPHQVVSRVHLSMLSSIIYLFLKIYFALLQVTLTAAAVFTVVEVWRTGSLRMTRGWSMPAGSKTAPTSWPARARTSSKLCGLWHASTLAKLWARVHLKDTLKGPWSALEHSHNSCDYEMM